MSGNLFQHSTIGALNHGFFEGSYPVGKLLEKGNLGIGTLDGAEGEIVILEGVAYNILTSGEVKIVPGEQKTPYAAVADFEATDQVKIENRMTRDQLESRIESELSSQNAFQALSFHGEFESIKCRSLPKQEKPYTSLTDVAEQQAEFSREHVTGTLLGLYTPEKFDVISVPGFHVHFLSDDHQFGGHILDYTVKEGLFEMMTVENFELHFPLDNPRFMSEEINYEKLEEELREAER